MKFRVWLNRHIFLTILILCLIILSIACLGFINASDNATLYIKDLAGSSSALDNVVINGIIQDAYHGIKFSIENQETARQFVFYDTNQDIQRFEYDLVNTLNSNEVTYTYQLDYIISQDANVETSETREPVDGGYFIDKITKADAIDFFVSISAIEHQRANTKWDQIRINSGVGLKSNTLDFGDSTRRYYDKSGSLLSISGSSVKIPAGAPQLSGSNPANAFTILNDCLYFTVLSSPDHRGSNGIFKVEGFTDQWHWMTDDNSDGREEYGNVNPITVFNLDDRSLSVLGLKAVNGRLVLIVIEDNMLILRSYHPETGELIDELPIQEFSHDEYGGTLQAFTQGSKLNLHLTKSEDANQETHSITNILISVDVNDSMSLLHYAEGILPDDKENSQAYIENMVEADQKLFVFSLITNEDEKQGIPFDILWPKHYMMFVYQGNELLYKGEFITDIDEDFIADRERTSSYNSGFGYNQYQFRQIYGIQVEEK